MKFKIFLGAILLTSVFCFAGNVSAQSMTDAERQTLIAQLTLQINQLQQQVAQIIAQQQGSSSWCHTFNSNIGYDESGSAEVVNLHLALQREGISYSPDDINTYSSTGTEPAVERFQAKYAISPQSGYVGPLTRTKLNQLYGCNATNPTNPTNPTYTCTPNWQYGSWSTCSNSQQTRTVTDYNGCGTTTNKPATTQFCSSTCTPSWQYGSWSTCTNDQQTRTVTDYNNCGITTGRPATTQFCSSDNTTTNNCVANCVNQSDGVYAVDCYGRVEKCDSGETCEKTYTTDYTYNNSSVQTLRTLTGSDCKAASSICTPDWNCSGFGSCSGGQQSQTCTDDNDCNTTTNRPALTRSCSACTPNWQSGTWSTCSNSQQTRTVTDANSCGTTTNKPVTTQSCTVSCTPNWQSGAWSSCVNASQTRTVIDSNNCGVIIGKPVTTQSCQNNGPIVRSPNGGEQLAPGSAVRIMWDSASTFGVKVDLYKGGTFLQTIIANTYGNTALSSPYTWTIPTNLVLGNDYKIRTTYLGTTPAISGYDESDANFSIVEFTNTIAVTYPNGGEVWTAGETRDITWTSSGTVNDANVKIGLYEGGTFLRTIVGTTANNGRYTWEIPGGLPNGVPTGKDYKIRVSNWGDASIYDESNANFTISEVSQSVKLTSPNGGEQITESAGSTYKITWDTAGSVPVERVTIQLFKGSALYSTIATGTLNTLGNGGTYNWSLSGVPAGDDYKIKISNYCGDLIYGDSNRNCNAFDQSDATFSIAVVSQSLTITSPSAGDTWKIGENHNITWNSSGQPADSTMSIVLVGYGPYGNPDYSRAYNITPLTTDSSGVQLPQAILTSLGTYNWKVPSSVIPGLYLVEMQGTRGTPTIFSGRFSIITASTAAFTISCTDTDGGLNYNEKGTVTSNGVTYSDMCNPSNAFNQGERICGSDGSMKLIYYNCPNGCEDGACKNSGSNVTVTSPNGGETFTKGSNIVVNWTSQGVSNVFVEAQYYNSNGTLDSSNPINGDLINGGTECRVTDFIPASNGTFTITGGNTGKCGLLSESTRIKILVLGADSAGAPVGDESNNYFSIVAPSPAATSCTDTDSGKNYNITGRVTGSNGIFGDYCAGSQTVREYYCSSNSVASEDVTCPAGCLNGKCDNSAPYVTITSPNGGNSLSVGGSYTIKWNTAGASSSTVTLKLVGPTPLNIASNVLNSGSYNWNIPNSFLGRGNGYKVYIVTASGLYDYSDSTFGIW